MTLACPTCGSEKLEVISTRRTSEGKLRRRECAECKARVSTLERVAEHRVGARRKYTALQHLYQDLTAAMLALDIPLRPLPNANVMRVKE